MVVGAPESERITLDCPSALPYRISREDFSRWIEAGVFGERDFELLDGELYEIMGQNRPHRVAARLIAAALRTAFGPGYSVDTDIDIPLGASQPQPDVLVLRGTPRELADRDEEEGPEDVALIVEIVDTRADTAALKRNVYSTASIPEYWIFDVNQRRLIVHREPSDEGYRLVHVFDAEQGIRPLEVGAESIPVAQMLPPARDA